MKTHLFLIALGACLALGACQHDTSDDVQRHQQERLLMEGTAQVGMPGIKNFRERKLLKDILELRDQAGVTTYTYIQNGLTGRLVFLCTSIGYGIPYATQFTNPGKIAYNKGSHSHVLPQADPNGLFSPAAAEGTWIMCKDPNGDKVRPVFIEPRIVTSPFRLTNAEEPQPPPKVEEPPKTEKVEKSKKP